MLSPVSSHCDTCPHAQIPLSKPPHNAFDCRAYLIMDSQNPHQSFFQVASDQCYSPIPFEMG